MAAGNNIQISLDLNDTQFKNGIKRVGQQLQSLNGVKKLKVDVDANIAPFQQALKGALADAKKAGALSYTAKNGKTIAVSNVNDAIRAYKRYIELANSSGSTKEQNVWRAKANAIGLYIQKLSELGNELKRTQSMEERLQKATDTGKVRAARQKAYYEAMAPERAAAKAAKEGERAQKAADKRFRARAMEMIRLNDAAGIQQSSSSVRQEAQQRQQMQSVRSAQSRSVFAQEAASAKELANAIAYANRQKARYYRTQDNYMNKMASGRGNSNFELSNMRAYYKEQEKLAAKAAAEESKRAAAILKAKKAREKELLATAKQHSLLGRLNDVLRRYLSIFAVWNFGKKIIEITGYFEQQQIALEGILGSAAEAEKAISKLKSMALESPYEFKDLVGYAKQLSAYGLAAESLLPTTKKLADLSTGLGVDMQRLILAYGQVRSASVLRGQELRQFTEAGIPMVQALADKFTQLNGKLVTTGEVFDLISKRKVSFEMVDQVLSDMTNEGGRFYKMQENIVDTLYGQVQKLKDLWTISLNDTGSGIGGFLNWLVKAAQVLVKQAGTFITIIGSAAALKSIQAVYYSFKVISTELTTTLIPRMRAFNRLLRMTQGAASKAKVLLGGLGKALFSNVGIAVISIIAGAITNLIRKTKEFSNELTKIDKSFAKDNAKYVQGFDKLLSKLSSLTEGTKKYNEALDTLKNNYSDYVNPAIINQLIAERKQLDDTADGWGRLHDSIVAAINAKNDYERHKAKKEKAGDSAIQELTKNGVLSPSKYEYAMKKYADLAEAIEISYGMGGSEKYDKDLNKEYHDIRREITSKEGAKNITAALTYAIESFFSQGFTEQDELQSEIKRSFNSYGVADNVSKFVLENISAIWDELISTKGWKKYLTEHNAIENSDFTKIDKAFEYAVKTTAGRNEGRWIKGMKDEDYNPITLSEYGQLDAANAVKSLISMLTENIGSDNTTEIEVDGKIISYTDALKTLNDELGSGIESFADKEKTSRIAVALQNLSNTITDSTLRSSLSYLVGKFQEIAGIRTGRSALITSNITNDFIKNGVLDHKTKDIYARYVNQTTDETIDAVRNSIAETYKQNQTIIDSFKGTALNDENKKYVDSLKEEQEILKILAGGRYYDIDLTSKNKGRGAYNHNKEYDEFLNEFKSAYDMYKKAVLQGGVSMGAAFVQNNKQVQDMFGGFFNGGEFGDKFKQVKVGDKSVIDLIQDKFISDGVEKGIVDFKSAAEAVAAELKEQADTHKGTAKGQDYLQQYNSLTKWIQSTFSKDNIDGFLKDLEKSLNDLTLTFDKTTKNVELYRKIIEQGTQNTLGGMIGAQYKARVTTPQSTIMKGNIQKVVEIYNTELEKEATSNPDSAIAKTKNEQGLYNGYSFGQLNTIDDIYKALQQIDRLQSVNADNFQATEAGKILGSDLKPMLQSLLQQLITEISSISGNKYTGNSLSDAIANANINMIAARSVNSTAQANAKDKNAFIDYAAIQALVEQSSTNSTAIFDQFLAQNDFSVMFDALGKWKLINFDDLRKKLEELTKNLDPLTKMQLTEKFNELEKKVNEFNSSTGGNLFSNMHDYHTADKRAKAQYNETVAAGQGINGAYFDSETGQFSWIKNMVSAEDVATLTVLNAKLKEMGVNGENLSRSFKTDALKNMEQSIQSFSNQFNSMTNVVNSVVGALKSFSKALNDVYDVMNDGENPEWMQVMDDSINDFGEAFEAIIAPITAVIALVAALAAAAITLDIAFTPLLIIMIAIIAVAAAIAAIVAAFKAHDNALERSIDKMKESVEDFDTAVTNLNAAAERSTGLDKLVKRTDAVGKSISKASEYANMAAAEDAKKNTDYDKLKEYQQEQQEAEDEFRNSLLDMLDELVSSTEDWASAMGDAIRSAFQNGENAARSFRSTVKTMIGDVVENMLEMAILQPLIEGAIQDWTNQDYLRQKYTYTTTDKDGNTIDTFDSDRYTEELLKNLNNSAKAEDFYKTMIGIGNTLIDTENNLPDFLQESLWYNSDTQSLSGGIESITEDTARRLEALSNSQLGALLNIQSILQNYIGGNGMYSSSPMANIQSTVALIQGDTAGIRSATQTLLNEIRAVRTKNSQPLHVTLV